MKRLRFTAWLLVLALLALACPALGEAPEIELAGDAAEALPVELEVEDIPELEAPDGLDVELPGLDLSDDLSLNLDTVPADDANGDVPASLEPLHCVGDAMDNDRLFAGYVDLLFGRKPEGDLRPNGFIGDTFTGATKKVYDYLVKQIKKVAAGTISSTIFEIPTSIATIDDWDEIGDHFSALYEALLTDLPYHMFWHDKTQGVWSDTYGNDGICIMFCVADAYADWNGQVVSGSCFTTNSTKIKSAQVAVTNAKKVVKKYAGVTDYKKLCGYRDYICKAVDYNNDAASQGGSYDENAWQLIWALDGDPSTNVVCEGYSKAFQYLCDLTTFNGDIQSHIVTGTEYDQSGSGPHMWNIVTMENGKNYHVDITFIDSGYTGAFLCGAAKTQYTNTYLVGNELYYQLDGDTVGVYPAKTLKLSTRDYEPGDEVLPKSVKLKKGKTTLKKGQKLSLKRGKSLTLKAVVSPSKARTKLTWTSSYKYVTVKDGKVTVSRKAKVGTRARITVKTANKKSTYIYIVVK
ncbi:MAG: hypothetical protein IJI71_16760 [Clostridia bacterium]|nr:hypothetical protein [Clostridia bacterium]